MFVTTSDWHYVTTRHSPAGTAATACCKGDGQTGRTGRLQAAGHGALHGRNKARPASRTPIQGLTRMSNAHGRLKIQDSRSAGGSEANPSLQISPSTSVTASRPLHARGKQVVSCARKHGVRRVPCAHARTLPLHAGEQDQEESGQRDARLQYAYPKSVPGLGSVGKSSTLLPLKFV